MAITTYSELQTAIANWMNRSELTSRVPEFIANFEARFNRLIRHPRMVEIDPSFATTGKYTDLPADFLEVEQIAFVTGGTRYTLELVGAEQSVVFDTGANGEPRYYSIRGDQLELIPGHTGEIEFTYFAKLPALSNSATSNWLLAGYPDVYLWGSLDEAAPYMMDLQRVNVAAARSTALLNELKAEGRKWKQGPAMRVQVG